MSECSAGCIHAYACIIIVIYVPLLLLMIEYVPCRTDNLQCNEILQEMQFKSFLIYFMMHCDTE